MFDLLKDNLLYIWDWATCIGGNIYYAPRNLKEWLERCWDYGRLLWNDQDWDWTYVLRIMRLKFKRMLREFAHSPHESKDRTIRQIKYAIYLIDLIEKNDFAAAEHAAHDERWGDLSMKISLDGRVRFTRAKAMTTDAQDAEQKEFLVLMHLEEARMGKTWERLWRHLDRWMKGWWT